MPVSGSALQRKRQHRGLTQTALADKAGLTFGYVSRIERGHYRTIGPGSFIAICDALGLTTEDEREQIVDRTVQRPERRARAA